MSDAPILSRMNHVTDLDAADDFQKKHTPAITVEPVGDSARVNVKVGEYVPHPNTPDHYIQWIEVLVDGNPVARFDLSPVATSPDVSVVVDLDAGSVVRAVEYCNLHGLWAAEITL